MSEAVYMKMKNIVYERQKALFSFLFLTSQDSGENEHMIVNADLPKRNFVGLLKSAALHSMHE